MDKKGKNETFLSVDEARSFLLNTVIEIIDNDDILQMLMENKRSVNTRKAYEKDMKHFCRTMFDKDPSPNILNAFISLDKNIASRIVLAYKAKLIAAQLASATINRRIYSLKSFVKYAYKINKCKWTLDIVEGESEQKYRDTTGLHYEDMKKLIEYVEDEPREKAIIHIFWELGLRASEVCSLKISDYDRENKALFIIGKGRNNNKDKVSITSNLVDCIDSCIRLRGDYQMSDPLFIATDKGWKNRKSKHISYTAMYKLIRKLGLEAGLSKRLTPHMLRHTAITLLLDANGGNIREAMQFSRHKDPRTLMRYDDNRRGLQKEATNRLSNLFKEKGDTN